MIVFDHLRKTGGTFLKWEFSRRLNYAWLYPSGVTYDLAVRPRRGLQFICGHDQFSDLVTNESTFFFTFLRNPVDVVYSAASAHHRNLVGAGRHPSPRPEFVARRVDTILEHESSLHWTWRTKEQWRDLDPDRYDLVGVQEEMDASLSRLNRALGLDLTNHGRRNASGGRRDYRRADLESLFGPEIELWRAARRSVLDAGLATPRYDPAAGRKLGTAAGVA